MHLVCHLSFDRSRTVYEEDVSHDVSDLDKGADKYLYIATSTILAGLSLDMVHTFKGSLLMLSKWRREQIYNLLSVLTACESDFKHSITVHGQDSESCVLEAGTIWVCLIDFHKIMASLV